VKLVAVPDREPALHVRLDRRMEIADRDRLRIAHR
jgi:hypothetical protein